MFLQKILFIVTSHSKLGNLTVSTGLYLPQVAQAYYLFSTQYEVIFASPNGGVPAIDPNYFTDSHTVKFLNDSVAMSALNNSLALDKVVSTNYVAVYFPGGQGPMFDLATHEISQKITREIYEAGGVVGGVCHGSAGILNVKLTNGSFLIAGKNVTAFSNEEEDYVGTTEYMPFLLENQLQVNGANYSKGKALWAEHVVVDGRLVTGQNAASLRLAVEQIMKLLRNPYFDTSITTVPFDFDMISRF